MHKKQAVYAGHIGILATCPPFVHCGCRGAAPERVTAVTAGVTQVTDLRRGGCFAGVRGQTSVASGAAVGQSSQCDGGARPESNEQ